MSTSVAFVALGSKRPSPRVLNSTYAHQAYGLPANGFISLTRAISCAAVLGGTAP